MFLSQLDMEEVEGLCLLEVLKIEKMFITLSNFAQQF